MVFWADDAYIECERVSEAIVGCGVARDARIPSGGADRSVREERERSRVVEGGIMDDEAVTETRGVREAERRRGRNRLRTPRSFEP